MATHTARAVANWFLAWAEYNNAPITNLKLQKMLYYAQGHYLGANGEPLFNDDIEAWAHGPVVRSVYHDLKGFRHRHINVDAVVGDEFDWDDYRDIEDHLMTVWNTYGQFEAWALRDMTHREMPWKTTFESGSRYLVIPHDKMRAFFARR